MLIPEERKTYELEIDKSIFVVESVSPPNCSITMIDALVELMKRDIEKYSENLKENQ